jgi:two-component system phosphate regulon sensor histidine kinase PhoR
MSVTKGGPPLPSQPNPGGGSAMEREIKRLKEELDRVDRERIEYLQNVSHQLVAPLNAIKWHIENLTNNRVSVDRAKKVLRSIYSQSTIAVHLAKNFALMSNLDADHALTTLKEPLQEVNIFRLLVNLADDFQPLGWDKDLKISVINGSSLEKAPAVLAMKPLIGQAFSNIIENAVKYSNKGTEITVDGTYDERSDTVSVLISNRGLPLKDEDVNRVFDRGYRTPAAKNLYPAGTGFGLYIAKRIVELHEGAVSARPDGLDRATFEVVLPVHALQGKARQRD